MNELKDGTKLKPDHVEAIEKMMSCKAACKKMIEETAHHWEENYHIEQALWIAIRKEYELDNNLQYYYDYEKKEVRAHNKSTPRGFTAFFRANEYVANMFKKGSK